MIKLCTRDQENILEQIKLGKIDDAALSSSHLVDDILIAMKPVGIYEILKEYFPDKRAENISYPVFMILILAIAAKMRTSSSLTSIPFAITDHKTLCELDIGGWDTDRDISKGLMDEGTIRNVVEKYTPMSSLDCYNKTVQEIIEKRDLRTGTFMLDSTFLEVNIKNNRYEGTSYISRGKTEAPARGLKYMALRNVIKTKGCNKMGIIIDSRLDKISAGEIPLGKELLKNTPVLKPGDKVIMDRGFEDREIIDLLKKIVVWIVIFP